MSLHRQWHSLTRELKDAELALGQDNTETKLFAIARREGPAVDRGRDRSPDRGLWRPVRPAGAVELKAVSGWQTSVLDGRRAREYEGARGENRVSRSLTEFRDK